MQKTILKQQYENFAASRSKGLDKTYDRKDHFARDCRVLKNQGNRNGDNARRVVLVETPANALVVQDGIGGYDWSFQAEEGPTDFALMAYLSSGSSSLSSSDSEVSTCSKACLKSYEYLKEHFDKQKEQLKKSNLKIIGYQMGLESLEARIVVHEKNEASYEESIKRMKLLMKKSKVSETITSVPNVETTLTKTSKDSLEKPKTVRFGASIIEDWESDSEDENVFEPKEVKKTVKSSFEKIKYVNARNSTVEKPRKFNYQEVDGGFVAFARSPKGGKITGKGKIRTEKLDFEDVYFVKELKYQDDTQNNNLLPLLYDRPQSIRMQLPDDAGKNTIEEPRIEGGNETVYKEWEDRMERAATTASSLEAEQDSGSGPRCQVTILGVQKLKLDSGEVQITAIIDGKVKLVFEASIRRHLKLEDSDGITTLPNTEIFEQLTLMGSNSAGIPTRQETKVPQPSSPTYTNVADEAAFISMNVVYGGAATTVSSIYARQGSGNIPKSPTMPHDSPLLGGHTPRSDEGSMTLHELTVLCTKLSNKVDSLETELKQTKQTYGAALTKLIKKVKKLEQIVKTSQARRRAKIVVSDDEESSEDTSKQGRMIEDIDQDAGISLVTPTKVSSQEDQSKDQLGVLSAAKVLVDAAKKNVNTYTRRRRAVSTGSEGVSTASRIFSTAEESVSTAGASMPVSTAGMVQQVNIIIPLSSETTETIKDKGKAIMQESEQLNKIKKRVQIQMSLDEELAKKLHEEEQARFNAEQEVKFNAEQEELLASKTTEDEANPLVADIDWDDVQAQIQADKDLVQKLLEEERENLSIKERARLLAELIDKRKKLQAAQRYEAIRNKPQTMS
ncbi:hypothetical protein Tco_0843061 [Tanacetum coccineum]|uniref:Uncharacterized protein n=1 Tax=Tanacetum coccineum TaxID=301880 RepID=A0ABQ5B2R3_9ASTR